MPALEGLRQLLPSIDTEAGFDADRLDRLYAAPRPTWVRANFAVTLDGAVELDGKSGGIGGDADRALFLHLRTLADVVLVGAATVRAEGYGGVVLDDDARARRERRGQRDGVPVAVVTGRADLDPASKLFGAATRPIVLTTSSAPAARLAELADVADVEVVGDGRVEPTAALDALARRGLTRVHCEGGPSLLRDLLAAGALDELDLSTAPAMAGAERRGLAAGDPLPAPVRGRLASLLTDGDGTLFARYLTGAP